MSWLVLYVGSAIALVVVACVAFAIRLIRAETPAESRLAAAWWGVPCLWAAAVAFWSVGVLMVPGFIAFGVGFLLLALAAIVAAAVTARSCTVTSAM